jgi:predicted nucleotidyltransferase
MSRVEVPAAVREQLDRLTRDLRDALADELVGVYLHGSLVLGCFNPQRSDIDVIAVTRRAITGEKRNALGALMLRSSGQKERPRQAPFPLEMSLLTAEQLRPWRYPTPFDFHYGESQRRRFTAGEFNPLWAEDYDLAAHVTVLREAGVTLLARRSEKPFRSFPSISTSTHCYGTSAGVGSGDWLSTGSSMLPGSGRRSRSAPCIRSSAAAFGRCNALPPRFQGLI